MTGPHSPKRPLPVIAALAAIGLSGCVSVSYVDSDNVRHVIGFVDVAVKGNQGASAVQVTGLGLSAYSDDADGGGVVLGYSRTIFLTVSDQACIDLNLPGPCALGTGAVPDRGKDTP